MSEPRFPAPEDQEGFQFYNAEVFEAMLRRVLVHPFVPVVQTLQNNDLVKNIYGEDMRAQWPQDQVYEAACLISNLPGWKANLTKEGLDESRDLVAAFNIGLLNEAKHPLPKDGDLIELHAADPLQTDWYRVSQQNPTDYFGNLDRTYTWTVIISRHRFEAVSRAEVNEREPDPLYRD